MKRTLSLAVMICFIFVIITVLIERFSPAFKNKIIRSRVNNIQTSASSYNPIPPTLNTIFSKDHSWIATLSAAHIRTLLVTGDIIPARSVNNAVISRNNYIWPYERVIEPIKKLHPDIISRCSFFILS